MTETPVSTAPPTPSAVEWLHDWGEAMVRARAERKPVLVDVYQDDCYGCDKLDAVTFSDKRVIHAIRTRFIPLKLDLHQDREFTREQQVFWTPTILFADRSGRVRYTSPNYLPPDEFLDLLDIAEALVLMRCRLHPQLARMVARQGVSDRSVQEVIAATMLELTRLV
jgi:thiol:disulfide interchange protein